MEMVRAVFSSIAVLYCILLFIVVKLHLWLLHFLDLEKSTMSFEVGEEPSPPEIPELGQLIPGPVH